MTHHIKLYPPGDLLSQTYRQAGKDNTTLVFTPIITVGFLLFGGMLRLLGASWLLLGGLVFEGIVIGWMHDQMHTLFHLKGTMLNRFRWFSRLQDLHFYHHRNMKRNLGIFWFGWDRVLRTFRDVQ